MRRTETTDRGPPRRCAERYSDGSRHLQWGLEPYRVLARDAKCNAANGRRTSISRRTSADGLIRTEETMADRTYAGLMASSGMTASSSLE